MQEDTLAGYGSPFAEGITCTRCHGDGTKHVALREAGKGPAAGQADSSIVNPKRLSNQKQLRICQQCHLTGESRVLLERIERRGDELPLTRARIEILGHIPRDLFR